MDAESLSRLLSGQNVKVHRWGLTGEAAVKELEIELGMELDNQLAEFCQVLGNVNIGQFSIVVSGTDTDSYNAATQTLQLGPTIPERAVKILDHAGESYLYNIDDGVVRVYESTDFSAPTIEFKSFNELISWLLDEANRFENTTSIEF